jgi:hypothetical protein
VEDLPGDDETADRGPDPGNRAGDDPELGPDADADAGSGSGGDGVSAAGLVREILAESVRIGAAEARRLELIAALNADEYMRPLPGVGGLNGRRFRGPAREDVTESELVAGLKVSGFAARRLLGTALSLTSRLPGTLAALAAGELDLHRAMMVHEAAKPLADDHYEIARRKGVSSEVAEKHAANIADLLEGAGGGRGG